MMLPKHSKRPMTESNDQKDPLILLLLPFGRILKVIDEVCSRTHTDDIAHRQRVRQEMDALEAADAEILKTHAGAIFRANEIARRAERHGVVFSVSATMAHRSAILDFLDKPDQPTKLTQRHMTTFWGAGDNCGITTSMTHPVNRAVYAWRARHFAQLPDYDQPRENAALHRLRQQFSLHRVSWTSEQWHQYEQVMRGAAAGRLHRLGSKTQARRASM
jgi:hypothetical protein